MSVELVGLEEALERNTATLLNNKCACSDDNRKGRYSESGAYRDTAEGKHEYGGFLAPEVIRAFGEYMHKHRTQSDGELRSSSNWKKGMPTAWYYEGLLRHVLDIMLENDGLASRDGLDEALGGAMFNLQGLWRNHLSGE